MSWLLALLLPEAAPPLACHVCKASANSPLAIVCDCCGQLLLEEHREQGSRRAVSWGLKVAFVAISGLMGFLKLCVAPYVVAAVLFLLFGAGMLRNYKAAQQYFVALSILLFVQAYYLAEVAGIPMLGIMTVFKSRIVWNISWITIGTIVAALMVPLVAPLGYPRSRGAIGILLVLAALWSIPWLSASMLGGQPCPLWCILIQSLAVIGLKLFTAVNMFIEGFRVTTSRPGVIIEATQPFSAPRCPVPNPRNLDALSPLAKPFVAAYGALLWSLRLSLHHLLSSLVSISNRFVYWSELVLDMFLRSTIRAWRRSVELAKAFVRIMLPSVAYAALAGYRVVRIVLMPVLVIAASTSTARSLANCALNYVLVGELAALVAAALYTAMLFMLMIVVVGLLARCHPTNVAVKDGFNVGAFYLPELLLLIYAASIILSLLSWVTGVGPFWFGPLSIVLTVLFSGLVVLGIVRGRRQSRAATPLDDPHSASTLHQAKGERTGQDSRDGAAGFAQTRLSAGPPGGGDEDRT